VPLIGWGCGDDGEDGAENPSTAIVGLDFTPNAVHAPIYAAVRNGYDERYGVRLPNPPARILARFAHTAHLGARRSGGARHPRPSVSRASVGRTWSASLGWCSGPLAAIIAQPDIRRPRDLEGNRVGVSGLPFDPAVLREVMEGDGGDYDKIRQVTIGFATVPSLIKKRIDAVPAFWNAEGATLRQRGVRTRGVPSR
jgi:putative hydroxymethylpyrimidine transport system substrate-binding protein